jgi:hypothetical protein
MRALLLLTAVGALTGAARLAAADPKPVEPFNGKNLAGWKLHGDAQKSHWAAAAVRLDPQNPKGLAVIPPETMQVLDPALANLTVGGVDISTEQKFGSCTVELEFMVPQGSNSGVYLMGEYEVQILDSYGKEKPDKGDLGAIYGVSAPKVNAAKKPGEWQTLVIDFQAPKFAGGKKTANAKFLKVVLNGQVVQENVEVPGPTTAALTGKEAPTGPLMLQGDHGPVAFRHIKITPGK